MDRSDDASSNAISAKGPQQHLSSQLLWRRLTGEVNVGNGSGEGAALKPSIGGIKPSSLSIHSALTLKADSTYTYKLNTARAEADKVSANGVTIDHKFSQANGGTLWVNPTAFCDPSVGDAACPGSGFGNISRNKFYGPGYASVDFSVFKNVPITERFKLQLRAEMFNLLNRINMASGVGSVAVGGNNSPNYNTCNQVLNVPTSNHHCSTAGADGFGMITDTIGDFNGAPGIGPGEAFNMQLAIKLIF